MIETHKKFIKIFAALLPLAGMLESFSQAFCFASMIGAGALFVTHLFLLLKPLFPEGLFRVSIILFLAALFQIFQGLLSVSPFWMVSLTLLLDWNDFDPKHLGVRPLPPLVRVGIFFSGAIFIGILREGLGKKLGIHIFDQPAGIFAGLALFSAVILSLQLPLAPSRLKQRRKE